MSVLDRTVPPAPGAIRPFQAPTAERIELDNGLRLLTARHGQLPLVTAALVLEGGAAAEAADQAGVAYLTARAFEGGTQHRSAERLAVDLEGLGIELETAATWDAAILNVTVPRDRLDAALALFAEVVRQPAFPDPEVERLRQQQLAAILQRRTEPRALAGEAASRFIFAADVPYARPINGTESTVEGLTAGHVRAFYEGRYRPQPGALLLVGDVDLDDAAKLADRYFGDWPAARAPDVEFEVRPGFTGTTIFLVDRPGSVQSELRLGHVGVERRHPDYFALMVMNTVLGGAFTSRLNISLRERHGFTYGVNSHFACRRRPGPFLIQTAVATGVTARAVEETFRQIEALRQDGPTPEEVDAARDYLSGVMPLQFQTTEQLAGRLADLVVYDLPLDYYRTYRDRIGAVTLEDVHRAAREHVRPEAMAIVVVGDAAQVEEPLRALGAGPVQKYRNDLTPCT